MNGVSAAFLLRFIVGIDWSALTLMIGLWEWHPACKNFHSSKPRQWFSSLICND